MDIKNYRSLQGVSEEALLRCKDPDEFIRLLHSGAYMYKFNYIQQVSIFAQNPDATALASSRTWKQRFKARLRRNAAQIAVPLPSKNQIRYYYDRADTLVRYRSNAIPIWAMDDQSAPSVIQALTSEYQLPTDDLMQTFAAATRASVSGMARNDTADEYQEKLAFVKGSTSQFSQYLSLCAQFQICVRCNQPFPAHAEAALRALHTQMMSSIAPQALKDYLYAAYGLITVHTKRILGTIELAISSQPERRKTHVYQSQDEHQLSGSNRGRAAGAPAHAVSEPTPGGGRRTLEPQEVGDGQGTVSGGHRDGRLLLVPGDVLQPPSRDSAAGRGDGESSDESDDEPQRGSQPQDPAHTVDSVHEQPSVQSGRGDSEGADRGEARLPEAPDQEVIDQVLRCGSNRSHSVERIIAYHQLQGSDFPSMLREEYCGRMTGEGGRGLILNGERYSAWYAPEGIHIAQGETVHTPDSQLIAWEQAAERIGFLLSHGSYQPSAVISRAVDQEYVEIAEQLWYLHQDYNREHTIPFFMEEGLFQGGFEGSTNRIVNELKNPVYLQETREKTADFLAAYQKDKTLLRWHFHQIDGLLGRMEILDHARLQYPAPISLPEEPGLFMTQDELTAAIRRGPLVSNGKQKIQDFFLQEHPPKELADFLQTTYGTGGYSNGEQLWVDFDGKGITFRRGIPGKNGDIVKMSWSKLARQVAELIASGTYLDQPTPEQEAVLTVGEGEHYHDIEVTLTDEQWEQLQQSEEDVTEGLRSMAAQGEEAEPRAGVEQSDLFVSDSASEPDLTDYIVLECLTGEFGLLENADKYVIGKYFDNNLSDATISRRLAATYDTQRGEIPASTGVFSSINKETGEITQLSTQWLADEKGFHVTTEGLAPIHLSWLEVVPILSTLYLTQQRGFLHDAEEDVQPNEPGEPSKDETGVESSSPEEKPEQGEFPYREGDTVYLEDGKPFLIESVGLFDVQLRDPSSLYPVLRAESKENLLRLIQRYPQQEQSPEPEPTRESAPPLTSETVEVYPAGPNKLPYDIVVNRLHVEPPMPTQETEPDDRPVNFRITDPHLGEGGPKAKYEANLAAIRVLKQLEAEHRSASPEEQEQLSRYVGWGGVPDVFDDRKTEWAQEYATLKELLTPAEYRAARESVLNAHYTSPAVIRSIYSALDRLGFQSGRILEPSCGVGNFFGLLPEKMSKSQLYGVELDSISGRIATQLYPDAAITVAGFEQTSRPGFYDVALGNVPFGQYEVNDPAYNDLHFSIHNFFFAKALDQVRPGGLVAFITSRHTMDSKSTAVRRYLAQRAALVGAIRLPNNAFKANAGTEVTSDIIILQRRSEPLRITEEHQWPEWVNTEEILNQKGESLSINRYFPAHPEMVLGHLELQSTRYGHDVTCAPRPDLSLEQQLSDAVERLPREIYQEVEKPVPEVVVSQPEEEEELTADESVRNFSYTAVDGQVYYRENDVMTKVELSPVAKARMLGLISLGEMTRTVIQAQLDGCSDEALLALQERLNTQYDVFSSKFGRVNSRENRSAFSNDSTYYLICSLEDYSNGKFVGKSDLFTKRTIRQTERVVHCDVPRDALAVSLNERGRVDVPFMAQLLDMSETEVTEALTGQIYVLPETLEQEHPTYVSESEYLSGNIGQKLETAKYWAERYPTLKGNVLALAKAIPERITAAEIEVHLGATWIPVQYLNDFVREVILSTNGFLPYQYRYHGYTCPKVELFTEGDSPVWNITDKTKDAPFRVNSQEVWGIDHRGGRALEILEKTLNLKEITIFDKDSQGATFTNQRATTEARAKQAALQQKFSDWIFEDPERREALEELYNKKFNSIKPREYDGSYMTFPGMSPYLTLRPHQTAAVAHALYGGNTLFAHVVGAGKSAEMIATAMEGKRLGLHHKSLFVVPKHTIEQMAKEFVRFYPSANVLVARPSDFFAANRKKFCARIATGDYDAIIMSFSQFERIPVSQERQERILEEQIREIVAAQAANHDKKSFSVKQLVKMEKTLKARLEKLQDNERKDDVVTFEELGVDKLFVDEAHYYKNAYIPTKMTNVAGIGQSASQKCFDLDMKCQYLDEITGGKGVVFATGTPVSNTMSELFVMQRYLMRSHLKEIGLGQFDAWAATFGQTETQMELAPEGSGYRMKTRFSRFYNVPELMQLFQLCSDIRLSSDLNLNVPEASYHTVVAQPTPEQKEMMSELSSRAEAVHNHLVEPDQDNMLKITSDGRKIGLDARMIDPSAPDEAGSKVNLCVGNVLQIWKDTEKKRLTQIIFCDFSTPNPKKFNVYYDIRDKLLAAGVPAEEIAFIHDYNTDKAKDALFAKVRSGEVRVLMGSTQKLGVGTNVQAKLVAIHDVDAPWRPGDLEQRSGRIIRQGNQNKHVDIYRYVTNGSFDSYLFQILESKQRFIGQIMNTKTNVRDCKDADETVLSFAEIKSLCAGDPRIKERMVLDVEVKRLKMLKSAHQSQIYKIQSDVRRKYPVEIRSCKMLIENYQEDIKTLKAHPLTSQEEGKAPFAPMTIAGQIYDSRKEAGEAILELAKTVHTDSSVQIGTWRGMDLKIALRERESLFDGPALPVLILEGRNSYQSDISSDAYGTIARLCNRISKLPGHLEDQESRLTQLSTQFEQAKKRQFEPFEQDAELTEKVKRLTELTESLNLDRQETAQKSDSRSDQEQDQTAPQGSLQNLLQQAGMKAALRNGPVQLGNRMAEIAH